MHNGSTGRLARAKPVVGGAVVIDHVGVHDAVDPLALRALLAHAGTGCADPDAGVRAR